MIKVEILSENGIHARPASQIVNVAQQFESDIHFIKDGSKFNAKSIMNIMGMGLKKGDTIELDIEGSDKAEVEKKLLEIFEEING